MKEPINVQIIIPCINLWEKYTKACIDSVHKAAKTAIDIGEISNYRILLIDNFSEDETASEAGKLVSEHFAHHRNNERWSFSKTVNFGVQDAWDRGFTYAMVLNNDALLNEFAITELVERMNLDSDLGMATCLDATGECPTPEAIYDLKPIDKEDCPENEHPCFSAFMVRRKVWNKVGEFDEAFAPAYYEDNDYHYRMQLEGQRAITYPKAMFYHYGSRTQLEALGEGKRLTSGVEQHQTFIKKWGGDPGKETYKQPYNDPFKSIRSTRQNPTA